MGIDFLQDMMPLILKAGFGIQSARYMLVAAYALGVWEWVLCFSDEYLYVLKARWSSVKVFYLFCRYFPLTVFPFQIWAFVGNHKLSVCKKVMRPAFVLLCIFPMSAQAVFVIRTYAFTGRNKFILAFLVACWIGLCVTIFWVMITRFTLFDEWHLFFGDSGCFGVADKSGEVSWAHPSLIGNAVFHLCTFCLDTFMTVLVLIQCVRFRSLWGPLGKAFLSQGLAAYVILSVMNLVLAVAYLGPDRNLDSMANLHVIFSDIIACRLILLLRLRAAPPTQTMEDRKNSELVRNAIGRIEAAAESEVTDDDESDHNVRIENWD